MAEIASLGFEVDTSGVRRATEDLNKLAEAASAIDEQKQDRLDYMLRLAHRRGQHTVAAMEITTTAGSVTVKHRVEFP